jgi:hypothetical protein
MSLIVILANDFICQRICICHRCLSHQSAGFSNLIGALATSCKIISHAVSVAPVQGLTGSASGAANTSGDIVKKLDLLSNATLIQFLKNCGEVFNCFVGRRLIGHTISRLLLSTARRKKTLFSHHQI